MHQQAFDYLAPNVPPGLRRCRIPVFEASEINLEGYGHLVRDNHETFPLEIVRWPAQGWRMVDADTGNEGGTKQGIFGCEWRGDVLYGRNEAVGGHYILGYGCEPERADENHQREPRRILLWHANYHPDGGQLFFPLDRKPFVVPLAMPGDDVTPEDFTCFRFDGSCGLYIHPNVWHEGVFACSGTQRFFDRQGAVHARVSVDFPREFNCLLEVELDFLADNTGEPE